MPRRRPQIVGLARRKHRAYYDRILPEIGRVFKALECDYDDPRAIERVQALNTLSDRGDVRVIGRWRDDGNPSITEIARAVREGDYRTLQKLNVSGPTLQAAVADFLERSANTLNDKSTMQYRSTLNQLLAHFPGTTPLASITSTEAERFLWAPKETTGGEPWSASTQNDAKTVCGALWDLVIERERETAEKNGATPNVTLNPWKGKRVKVRKRTKTRHAYLLPGEWKGLITDTRIRGTPTGTLLALATLAGLRRGEICNLRTPYDVDLAAGLLRIQPREGEFQWYPKGFTDGITNSVRDVPIVPALMDILEEHIRRKMAGERYFLHGQWTDKPLGETTANDWAKAGLIAAGLTYGRDEEDSFTLHSCRHTYGTWMVSDGVPIPTVAKYMGNTPAVVLDTYAHHMPSDDRKALDAIQRRAA